MDDINKLRDELKETIDKEIGDIRNDLDEKFNQFKNDMNLQIQDMKNDLNRVQQTLKDQTKALLDEFANQMKSNDQRRDEELAALKEEMKNMSRKVDKCESSSNDNRTHIQTIATAYAGLSKTTASLDSSLPRVLSNSTDQVNQNFSKIFAQLKQLKNKMNEKPAVTERSIVEIQPEPIKIDLSNLNPRPSCKVEFEDPPDLPRLEKFNEIESSVDYIYEMVPKLQAILDCHHDKISSLPDSSLDRDFLNELIEKIRNAMAGMAKDLDDLKNNMNKGLTKADVARMIREMMNTADDDPEQTSVGCVKCIACGRDMRQVAGAMTEDEALRTLGEAPNSVAMFPDIGGGSMGQMYSRTLDRDGLESPRSKRPFRKCKVTKQFRPHPPSTP